MKYAIILILILLTVACQEYITEEKAQATAINFVNRQVRFTSTDNTTDKKIIVNNANNSIIDTYLKDGNWYVIVHVESKVDDEIKKADFSVEIDAETGQVTNLLQDQ